LVKAGSGAADATAVDATSQTAPASPAHDCAIGLIIARMSPRATGAPGLATIRLGRALTQGHKNVEHKEGPVEVPLEIAFHNLKSSEWAEQDIRSRVADLERRYGRLVSCRVRIDQRDKSTTSTIPPVVHIELGIPGRKDLVVSHEPDHLQRKYRRPDLRKAIREAFRIAERQLVDLKEQRDGRTKEAQHHTPNQALGQIVEIDPAGEFGFLLTNEGSMLYFHRNSVLSGSFEHFERGDEVHYVEDAGDTGPTAAKVRVKRNGNG
jgi:cold shock CspA family protein